MNQIDLLQIVTDGLFLVIFLVVALKAVRQPRRATLDTALLFGAATLIVLYTLLAQPLRLASNAFVGACITSLLMALAYLLLRLVEDFTDVPRPVSLVAVVGLALAVLSFFVLPASARRVLTVPYIVYFLGLALYASMAFVRAARRASGVTRRRLQAVALGSLFLGLDIVMAGLRTGLPTLGVWWNAASHLCGLGAGIAYFVGFAPPSWLRRAWQEPELRALLSRAALLPRLPTTQAIVREMERGAAAALGAPRGSIFLWDAAAQVLRTEVEGQPYELRASEMIGSRAFATQRPLFWSDAAREDPGHAAIYRAYQATAVLAAPITAGATRLGVLLVYAPRPSIFAEDDLMLVQLLADQAAVILESRALIDEATRVQAREEATRLKDDFLSAAAHDLKTPLTALLGQAQLLERRASRDPAAPADRQGIGRIVAETQRLRRLVLALLDVARVEQGQLVGPREPVDLVAVATESCARVSSSLHRCEVEAREPVVGDYDPIRLMQLVDNLLENAVKYSPEGGDIQVRVWAEGQEAHLTVTDQGIGIPAADLPHLFERFHRAGNVTAHTFAGLGLGLYICQAIVAQHGGRLWATSDGPAAGSTFHVMLPLARSLSMAPTATAVNGGESGVAALPAEATTRQDRA